MKKQTRPLNIKELKALQRIKATSERELKKKRKVHYLFFAILLGTGCVFLASWTVYDLFTFVFGTIAVFSFSFVVFAPYEALKDRRKANKKIEAVDALLTEGVIEVSTVNAKQIAIARAYKDEGDLYLIEMDNNKVLYLWDNNNNLKKNFPCLTFEIYDERFYSIIGKAVNALSPKIKPIVIGAKAKWAYLKKYGAPEHLEVSKRNFSKVVEQMSK